MSLCNTNKRVSGSVYLKWAINTRKVEYMSNQASCVNLKSDQIGEYSSISNVTEGGVNGRRLRDGSKRVDRDGGF